MADISIIHDGDNGIDYNIKDAIGRANCATGLQNLEDCIISILPESAIDDTPPISFLSNGDPLSSVVLIGNGQQTGTPTPDNIIMPTFCGVRTAQLFDKNATNTDNGYILNGFLASDGSVVAYNGYRVSEYIAVSPNQSYTLVYGSSLNVPSLCFYDSSKNFISGITYNGHRVVPFTTPQNAAYLRLSSTATGFVNAMLNTGSTALPYEPYGWKIPISSASTTTPVYLGEVGTTRKIGKLVLENANGWLSASGGFYTATVTPDYMQGQGEIYAICSHFPISPQTNSITSVPDGYMSFTYTTTVQRIYVNDSRFENLNAFKQYIAAQYTAGTPVTVWYVLAEPQTAIVNEPLCKIGDYADELHSTDAGVSIPIVKGQNTLTVETDLQPSGIKVIGNIVGTGETESHIVTDNVDTPTDILSNSDLDTYITDGVYRITDIFIAATILNAPVTNVKYILEVFSVSDTDTIQRITTESDIYTRQKSSGVWGSWYKFTGTEVSA